MGKTAFLFPGQGSQKPGMGREFYDNFDCARELFDSACDLLGFDLKALCFEGPEEELKKTENAQPALYTTSLAALRAFQSVCSLKADAVAGHSVGEYAAIVAAGSLPFDEGLRLVRRRGELMRDAAAAAPGTMAAILGLDSESVRAACDEVRHAGVGMVGVANYNGGGQVVISGEAAAVERAGELAKARGAKRFIPIAVSGAFHSPLMVMAGDALYTALSAAPFAKPKVPIVANVSAAYVQTPADFVGGLTRQVSASVRWEESIQLLLNDGITTFLEFGSGEVLTGLMRRIDKTAVAKSINGTESLNNAVKELNA